jgi:hypothetical protein
MFLNKVPKSHYPKIQHPTLGKWENGTTKINIFFMQNKVAMNVRTEKKSFKTSGTIGTSDTKFKTVSQMSQMSMKNKHFFCKTIRQWNIINTA